MFVFCCGGEPRSTFERTVTTVGMVFGAVVYAVILSKIGLWINSMDGPGYDYAGKMLGKDVRSACLIIIKNVEFTYAIYIYTFPKKNLGSK